MQTVMEGRTDIQTDKETERAKKFNPECNKIV